MSGRSTVTRRLGYCPTLDGLRAVAVLAVIALHSELLVKRQGAIGVDVFFVLSGFLITCLLLEEWERREDIGLKRFYIRRLLRLFPALTAMLVIVSSLYWLVAPPELARSNCWDALAAFFYVTNWGKVFGLIRPDLLAHTWTLSIEEQFYLLWPPILLWLLRSRVSRSSICSWLCLSLLFVHVDRAFSSAFIYYAPHLFFGTDARADTLLIGCLAGVLFSSRLLPEWWSRTSFASQGLTVAAISVLIFLSLAPLWSTPLEDGFVNTSASLAAGALILQLASGSGTLLTSVLSHPALVNVGRVSYGLYLWHHPIFRFVQTRHWPRPLELLVGLSVSTVATIVSFVLIERPFLKLKDRLKPYSLN